MTLDLSNPDTDLVSLLEIEIGHRIDEDGWILAAFEVTNSNKYIDFAEVANGGGENTAELTLGIYTAADLATEIGTKMSVASEIGATYTCTYNAGTKKFTISFDGAGWFNLLWQSGSHSANSSANLIGFDNSADDDGLTSYTADYEREGDYVNLWYITHAEGEPSKVEECIRATLVISTYTEQANLADCNDNPSSWYWDAANNRLYLHTSGSDDPGTAGKYLIMSYFWEYFCNKQDGDIVFNNHFYLPYLDDTIPPIRMETSGYHEGGTLQTFGTISVINADGYFDTRLSDYVYEAKKIRYLVGERGDIYADYIVFWIGWTGNIGWNDEYVTIGIDDLRKCREY